MHWAVRHGNGCALARRRWARAKRRCRLGHAALNIECLDMNAMFSDIVKNMQYQIDQRGTTVNIGAVPDCFGDRNQTFQVFTNLSGNAVKYTDPDRKGLMAQGGSRKRHTYCFWIFACR